MKKISLYSLVCLLALGAFASKTKADTIIYQDNFSGTGTDLSGATPTIDNGGFGGTAGATWSTPSGIFTENGGSASTPGGDTSTSAILPFTPLSGEIYTLKLNIVSTGAFGQVGFNLSSTGVTSQLFYQDGTHSGVDWAIDGGTTDQEFAGPGAGGNTYLGSGNGQFVITLNTTNPAWSYSITAPGASAVTGTYSTNPDINGVGLGMLFGAGVTYTGFSLTTNVPEPSTYALLATGLAGLVFLVRRRRA